MDSPKNFDMGEDVRMSPKLSSRRKRSRPVKFNQDYIMTDDLPNNSGYLSPGSAEKESYENPESFMTAGPGDFLKADDVSPPSSPEKIHRQVTSIRDVSLMKGTAAKRVKLEENGPQDSRTMEGNTDGQQTTFSSLLHTFASQVNNRVENSERQSPYSDSSVAPKTIWPVTTSISTTPQGMHQRAHSDTSVQRHSNSPSSTNTRQGMSFSGMLQNFVSCVNDSPPTTKAAPPPLSSLKSLLTPNQQPVVPARSTPNSPFTGNLSAPAGKEQQSFAGLLHSFASVVDKGNQESLLGRRHRLGSDHRSSPTGHEHTQKGPKSLLDVLHDTISRRVLETIPSPPQDESSQQTKYSHSAHNTQLDKVMQFNMDIPAQAKVPQSQEVRRGNMEDGMSVKSLQVKGGRGEPEEELHPNSHQWSHIRNVLPPLDDNEDTYLGNRQQSQSDNSMYAVPNIKTEPPDEEPSVESSFSQEDTDQPREYLLSGTASQDDDYEPEDSPLHITIKQEPLQSTSGNEWEMSNNVNSTLRERLLMRIESRQSLHQSPSQSSSSTPPAETQQTQKQEQRNSNQLPDESPGNREPVANRGLVSQLLSSENSSTWRNRSSGSFADLLHNITSSMLEQDSKDDKKESSQSNQKSIKQEPVMSDEEPESGSVQDFQSAQGQVGSLSLTSLLQKERTSHLQEPVEKKKVPRCISRLLVGPSHSSGPRDLEFSDGKGTRAQKKKLVSYVDPPSLSSSSLSSDDVDQNNTPDVHPPTSRLLICSRSGTKHSNSMKHRWKRGQRYGLKIKQGWPSKRRDDLQKRSELRSVHATHKPSTLRRNESSSHSTTSTADGRNLETDTMSFTDILQKLAQKCQAGGQDPSLQGSFEQHVNNPEFCSTPNQTNSSMSNRQQVSGGGMSPLHPDVLSNVPSSANLKNLLQKSSLSQVPPKVQSPPSGAPSTSGTSRDVSFSDIMQNMASTVTKKKGTSTVYEDLRTLNPPAPWIKSMSGNWLRFILLGEDENPRINMSVSINLWNTINEVKIHCHHIEVPANHWIFRRFGKRIHTKAALQGVLQAISNGCSVCEGTTRGDLVHMYRNKLASTSRWQAAALLEDSFGTATIRSSQCELLVSGLRRSREKRCSKCSKFVDRKLKAVMYHMKKKLGIS
nr:uncharacterized protein LOC129270883 [Lytechinus pictus]